MSCVNVIHVLSFIDHAHTIFNIDMIHVHVIGKIAFTL